MYRIERNWEKYVFSVKIVFFGEIHPSKHILSMYMNSLYVNKYGLHKAKSYMGKYINTLSRQFGNTQILWDNRNNVDRTAYKVQSIINNKKLTTLYKFRKFQRRANVRK
jgi:hypothetical protein